MIKNKSMPKMRYKHIFYIDGVEIEKIYDKEEVEHEFVSRSEDGQFLCNKCFTTKGELLISYIN